MPMRVDAETGMANRGLSLEKLIEMSNENYKQLGVAVIHKVPSRWIPLRNKQGKIVSAKIEDKAAVDFMGRYLDYPLAFDAKSVSKGKRWYMRCLDDHQLAFLCDWNTGSSVAGVLLGFWDTKQFFFVPLEYLLNKRDMWQQGGKASLHADELENDLGSAPIVGWGIDYLKNIRLLAA